MNDFVSLTLALAAGVSLGAIFFGGLWLTVRKGVSSQRPALWFFGSLLSRMSITLAGFYFVAREDSERWLLCLLGFVLTRLFARWLTGSLAPNQTGPAQEVSYAP